MDAVLYAAQIAIGVIVVGLAIAGPIPRRAERRAASMSLTSYADAQVGRAHAFVGGLFGVGTVLLGASGLVGTPIVPALVSFVLTMVGLISVMLVIVGAPRAQTPRASEFVLADAPRRDSERVRLSKSVTARDPGGPATRAA